MVTMRSGMPAEACDPVEMPQEWTRAGFTLVEVIIAIIVLAFGLLGLAGTTALVVRQVNLAEIAHERSLALQSTIEGLRALPFDSVVAGSDSVGVFQVRWTVVAPSNQWKAIELITIGPGMSTNSGGYPVLLNNIPDTFTYRIIRP